MTASLNTARALLSAGNYDGARRAVRQYLETEPEDFNAVLLMIEIELDADKTTKALELIYQALATQPDNIALRRDEIETLVRMGKRRRSRLRTKQFREDFPHHSGLIERFDILFEMKFGDDKKAAKKLQDFSPFGNEAVQGVLLSNSGRLFEGQRLLNEALERDPTEYNTNRHLAFNQMMLARPFSARKAIKRALTAKPTDGTLRWLNYLSWFSLFPSVYLLHLILIVYFMAMGYLPKILALPIVIVAFLVIMGISNSLETYVENLGVPNFGTFSTCYVMAYFGAWILLSTPIPEKLLGTKRKVKLKDY